MPTQIIDMPGTARANRVARPDDEASDRQSSAPAMVLVAIVALTYCFLAGTLLGQAV